MLPTIRGTEHSRRRLPGARPATWCVCVAAAVALGGCSQSDVVTPVASVPDTVVITLESAPAGEQIEAISALTLTVGESVDLGATAYNALGFAVSGVVFSWLSASPGVATVSVAGVVEGVASGTSTVSASSGEVTAVVEVTVTPAPSAPDSPR